jgi:hypothetical protein
MIKVYLLLRNNKQSGPYSLEEIAQQQLKPLDLVWIEGRSAAWKYASEIAELSPFLPEGSRSGSSNDQHGAHEAYLPKSSEKNSAGIAPGPKKIHVSLPANVQPGKTTPVQKTQPPVNTVSPELPSEHLISRPSETKELSGRPSEPKEKLVTKYSSTLEEKEEAYTEWIYKSKSKKNTLAPEWIGGIAVIVLLLMGSAAYYLKNKTSDKVEITQSTGDATATEELTSTQPEPESSELPQTAPLQEEPAITAQPMPANTGSAPSNTASTGTSPSNTANTSSETAKPAAPVKSNAAKQQVAIKPSDKQKVPAKQEPTGNTAVAVREETRPSAPAPEVPVVATNTKTSKTSSPEVETVKQKKTFSEKVDGFFNKVIKAKKVEPGLPAGSPEPPATEGDRKAVKRGEAGSPEIESSKKDLSAGIQVTTIEPSNTWMQGVHGLKMKVENRNDVKVSNASVEVRYLNDQNAVIEKKTIRLSSIAPGKQITMNIPDHRLADHATATLISASN